MPAAERPHVRLVSAHLKAGGADPATFAELVQALDADVVAVQELASRQAEALAAVMPFGMLEPASGFKGMGIALRAPGPVRRLTLPYRDAHVAEVTPRHGRDGVEPVEVINVHIVAPHTPPLHRTLSLRGGQLRALERHLDAAPERCRMVVGDFNSTPLWPLYRRLAARLTDAAVAAARRGGSRPRRTWGPWPGGPRLLRIDHVLISGLEVEAVRVVHVAGSDHSALVVDLSVPT